MSLRSRARALLGWDVRLDFSGREPRRGEGRAQQAQLVRPG